MSANDESPATELAVDPAIVGDATQESSRATSSLRNTPSLSTDDIQTSDGQTESWKGWAELENDPVMPIFPLLEVINLTLFLGRLQHTVARMGSSKHSGQ